MTITLRILIIIVSLLTTSVLALSDDYPKTREEKKAEEIGSLAGPNGITFSPKKIKNEATKTTVGSLSNKYLWQAALEVLSFAPLSSVDSSGGVIITDWYSPKEDPKFSYKINVFIKGAVISPDSINVRVFERVGQNARSVKNDTHSALENVLEDKILRKAREFYIEENRKD